MNEGTNINVKFKNSVSGLTKLEEYEKRLDSLRTILDSMPNSLKIGNDSTIKNSTKELDKMSNGLIKNSNAMNKIFGVAGTFAMAQGFKSAVASITNFTKKSGEYVENLNLMNVAYHRLEGSMNDSSLAGEKLVNTLSEMYGLNESELTRTVGIFKQLANAMNLSDEVGSQLAETLTKLSIDTASLYNLSFERASGVLQSALAGQTKPVRGAFGADITETTLQLTLDTYGIDTTIRDLSFVEKRLIIVTSLLNQLKESQNDYGKTVESVANQSKVFNEQLQRLGISIGNVFLPLIQSMLPYLNAILMVLTEVISTFAVFLGFDANDYGGFASGDITADIWDMDDALSSAGENAKKLKQGLRGFDKLNVINTPTKGSGAGGSGGGTSLDPKILDAFNKATAEYEERLQNIKMRATEIRDNIMEWLGFTKEINPLTGEVSWEYEGIKKTLKNMWNSFKKLNPEAKLLVGFIGALFTTKLINTASKFVKLIGKTGLYTGISNLLSPLSNLGKELQKGEMYFGETINTWSKSLTIMDKMKLTIAGAGGLIISFGLLKDAMKDVSNEGYTLNNTLQVTAGALGNIGSGALIGSQFGGAGAVIGGVTGALISFLEVYMSYPSEIDKTTEKLNESTKATMDYLNSLEAQKNAIQEQLNIDLTRTGIYKNMIEELDKIVEVNGKVKKGYEENALFIISELNEAYGTELKMIDGVIKGYDKQIEKIQELIEKEEAQLILEANRQLYVEAIQNEVQLYKEKEKALKELEEAQKEEAKAQEIFNEKMDKAADLSWAATAEAYKYSKSLIELKKARQKAQEASDKATKAYKENILTQNAYSNLKVSVMTGDLDAINKAVEEYTNSYVENDERIQESSDETLKRQTENYRILLEEAKKNDNDRYNQMIENLRKETEAIEKITPEQASKWSALGKTNKEAFLKEFSKLDEDVQQNVVSKMYDEGYRISEELQKGISSFNPTIKFKGDTSGVEKAVNNMTTKMNNSKLFDNLKNLFGLNIKLPKISFNASGGMPPVGQLFVANEKGPELVGQIGGRSFVANQNQMMDLLDKKIGNAQGNKGINSATFVIQVGSEEIARKVLNDLNDMASANGSEIVIGG